MATEEDLKKAEDESTEDEAEAEAPETPAKGEGDDEVRAKSSSSPDEEEARDAKPADESDTKKGEAAEDEAGTPIQLGYLRYVYAAYMAAAMIVGFLAAKIGHAGWYKLGQWKPEFGEPKDEILYPVAALIGVLVAVYYWRKAESRKYVMEVAEELSKVTWPSRKEVTNSTTVVVLTTVFATVFFALMDRFWGFITDKIYTF